MFSPLQLQTITIMADFGNGPYAWLKNSSEESEYVGINIADYVSGFGDELSVSEALEIDFMNWVSYFEADYDKPDFNWTRFNQQGVEMAKRLYLELNRIYCVIYQQPIEDPAYKNQGEIQIFSNASIVEK